MRKLFCTLFALSLFAVLTATSHAAPPAVDGFLGVPWGAGREQVAEEMAKNGFIMLEQRDDGYIDTYKGTFAGHPAELQFRYWNNVFYSGSANLLDTKNMEVNLLKIYYEDLKKLYSTKYGSLDSEWYGTTADGRSVITGQASWERLPTTAIPSAPVKIRVYYGVVLFGTGYGKPPARGIQLEYSIGEAWARLKTDKNGI